MVEKSGQRETRRQCPGLGKWGTKANGNWLKRQEAVNETLVCMYTTSLAFRYGKGSEAIYLVHAVNNRNAR